MVLPLILIALIFGTSGDFEIGSFQFLKQLNKPKPIEVDSDFLAGRWKCSAKVTSEMEDTFIHVISQIDYGTVTFISQEDIYIDSPLDWKGKREPSEKGYSFLTSQTHSGTYSVEGGSITHSIASSSIKGNSGASALSVVATHANEIELRFSSFYLAVCERQ